MATAIDDDGSAPICEKCGLRHIRLDHGRWFITCKAHLKHILPLQPCIGYPVGMSDVCKVHGGMAPSNRIISETRKQQHKAAAALVSLGMAEPDVAQIDPFRDLLLAIWRSGNAVRFWAEQIALLEVPDPGDHVRIAVVGEGDEATPMEVLGDPRSIIGPDRWGELRFHPYVKAWNDERTHHEKLLIKAIEAGVDERMVSLAEEYGAMMARVIGKVLEDPTVGLTAAQKLSAYEASSRELIAVSPGDI